MAKRTKGDLFDDARQYLDTDELNFPNDLCDMLMRRVWFQAVSLEREWRFFQQSGTVAVTAGQTLIPFSFAANGTTTGAVRIYTVRWGTTDLRWTEYTHGLRMFGDQWGEPVLWSELNDGTKRNIRLFPIVSQDGTLAIDFYLEAAYPETLTVTFADLPEEFDAALLEGLLADMYMREEDPDLYDVHRAMFLEQMGSIRNRWRESLSTPLVVAGRARAPGGDPGGFDSMGRLTQPVAPG